MKGQYCIAGALDMEGKQGYSSGMHRRSQEGFNRNAGPCMPEPKAGQSRKKRNSRNLGDASYGSGQ